MDDEFHLHYLMLFALIKKEYDVQLNEQQIDNLICIILKQSGIPESSNQEKLSVFRRHLDRWLKDEPVEKLLEELEKITSNYFSFSRN